MTLSWPRKEILWTGVIAIVVGFLILAVIQFSTGHFQQKTNGVETIFKGGTAYLRLANTEESLRQGLSGVTSLKSDQGLLMVFPTDDKWGIWMKDMKIPIDIVWLTKDKKVVYIVRDARSELSTKKTFTPTEPARYVIELNSGAAARYMINVGDIVSFEG